MFSLDDIDADFGDESFNVLDSKLKNGDNQLNNKGMLSYGVSSNDNNIQSAISSKRKCLDGHISNALKILDRSNDVENIKDYKEKLASSQQFDTNKLSNPNYCRANIYSPSYSPITSTQIEANKNKVGCLFDRSNKISPIKIKPGICSEIRKPYFNSPDPINARSGSFKIRKFPGPAGFLPKVSSGCNNFPSIVPRKSKNHGTEGVIDNTIQNPINVNHDINFSTSQTEESFVWKRAKNMIGELCWKYFENYTLDNVFKMLSNPKGGLSNSKIPVTCLIVADIEFLTCGAAAKLTDKTGSIGCAVHQHVLEKYNDSIKSGSVFILKKVSIFSPSGKKYYLNITKSNIIDIISPDPVDEFQSHPRVTLITQRAIDTILKECSETPKIVFDAQTMFQDRIHESVPVEQAPQAKFQNSQLDIFDDDMDDVLLSIMEEPD